MARSRLLNRAATTMLPSSWAFQ